MTTTTNGRIDEVGIGSGLGSVLSDESVPIRDQRDLELVLAHIREYEERFWADMGRPICQKNWNDLVLKLRKKVSAYLRPIVVRERARARRGG